jgi:hypothetical protein
MLKLWKKGLLNVSERCYLCLQAITLAHKCQEPRQKIPTDPA